MIDTLPDDLEMLKAMLIAERARAERLEQIIKELQRHQFGRRAETLPEDQLLLGFAGELGHVWTLPARSRPLRTLLVARAKQAGLAFFGPENREIFQEKQRGD
jgi:hypothetical protein